MAKKNHIIEPHLCTMWLEKIHLVETLRLSLSWGPQRIGRQYGMEKRKIVEVMKCYDSDRAITENNKSYARYIHSCWAL